MSDILKNNAISDDELGRVSGGTVEMTPKQREAAQMFVTMFRNRSYDEVISYARSDIWPNQQALLASQYGIESLAELEEFIGIEWGVIKPDTNQ